jgi:hypothetical protein
VYAGVLYGLTPVVSSATEGSMLVVPVLLPALLGLGPGPVLRLREMVWMGARP